MRLTKEREEIIRNCEGDECGYYVDELISEVDALRKDYAELTEVLKDFISKQEQLESRHRK